jgi:membrane associated rhomboid family serine protease
MKTSQGLWSNLWDLWLQWGWIERLIAVNVFVFVGLWIAVRINFSPGSMGWLALPANPMQWLWCPWTIVTYSISHLGLWHLLGNMLLFYWAAHFLAGFLGQRVLATFYWGGGIAGGVLFWLGSAFLSLWSTGAIPIYATAPPLIGASAAVLSFFWASVLLAPDFELRLFGIVPIRLRWLALAVVVYDILGLFSSNSGGHWAHLGGALWGWGYLRYLQGQLRIPRRHFKSLSPYQEISHQDLPSIRTETDRLLDKISRSGFASLSSKEKQWLDRHHRP